MSDSDADRSRPRRPPPGRSRRVSRRRYLIRRVVALAVIVLAGVGIVRIASALLSDDGDGRAAGSSPSSPAAGSTDVAVPTDAPADTADVVDGAAGVAAADPTSPTPTDVADVTTPPDPDVPPSVDQPASVYIVGDSDAGTFGPYLERLLDGTLIVDTELNYKVSSGLARPDFFDWPSELRRVLPEVAPDIVVVTFGGNDGQPLTVADGQSITGMPEDDTEDWRTEYERRAGEVMDLLLDDERTVIWVGIPNDDNPDVTARMAIQDQAAKAAAAARPGVIFIDTWTRFSGRDGGWAEFVIDPRDGQGKDVRASDGFHLNEVGAEILALDIAQAIRDDLRARGANI